MKRILAITALLACCFWSVATAQNIEVSGVVRDENSQPMPGVTVSIAGTTKGTTTDIDGKYRLAASERDILNFAMLGYVTVSRQVGKEKEMNISMTPDNILLSETVVIGYGTTKKSDLTGSVSSVNMSELADMPVSSADQALQGRIAGVQIVSESGEPGANSTIRVRGSRSISAGNDPLIVVDGVMDAVSSLSDINPGDIQNITVLKDVSSTAIYGSRGANGVILVTTKEGESGKVSIYVSGTVSINMLPKKLDVMNAAEFEDYRNDVYTMDSNRFGERGTLPSTSLRYDNPMATTSTTDWTDVLTRTGVEQSYFLRLTGGSETVKYLVSGYYTDNLGVVINSNLRTFGGTVKLDSKLGRKVNLSVKATFDQRLQEYSKTPISGTSTTCAIAMAPILTPESTWNILGDNGTTGGSIYNNPYIIAKNVQNSSVLRRFTIAPVLNVNFTKDLKLMSRFSFDLSDQFKFYYSPASLPVAQQRRTGGTAQRTTIDRYNILSETTLTYSKSIGRDHKFSIMGGFTAQRNRIDTEGLKGTGYLDDKVGPNNMAGLLDASTLTPTSAINQIDRMSGLFRANYSFRSRYFLTLTGRGDGSSNFSTGNKWAFFPAAAFKWSLIKENFMNGVGWINDLSLRLSGGVSGNDAVSSYVSQMALTTATNPWIFGDVYQTAYYPTRLDNTSLTWEKTASANIGIDFAVLKNRLVLTADAYRSRTTDLLLTVPNAIQSGYGSRYANAGSTQNWGVEFSLKSHNIDKKNFSWATNFTISHNSQMVTDIGADTKYISTYTRNGYMLYGLVPGYPANSLWGFKYAGVWHNQEEITENNYTKTYVSSNKWLGWPRYADINHDGILNDDDRVYLGSSEPIVAGGLQNDFNIYGVQIGVFFTYSIGGYMYNLSELNLGSGNTTTNQFRYMLDRYHPVRNPQSDLPGANCNDNFGSDRYVHDASFLRLQNLSIGYTFNLNKKVHWMKSIGLTLSAQNLFLLSKYNGFDPEVTSSSAIMRFDNGAYPRSRQFKFQVRFQF